MLTSPGAENLFRALIENSSDAVALVDDQARIRFASHSSSRVLGYEPDERVGRSAFDLVHPDDIESARAAFAHLGAHPGQPVTVEYRIQHKDGSWRWIEAVGVSRLDDPSIAGIVINYRDATDRRRAEEALRSSEERLRHLVEYAQDLIYYCDTNGRFTYVNPAAERAMKYDETELLGRHYLTLIHADYRERAAAFYRRQVEEGNASTYFEFLAVTSAGEEIWIGQYVQLVYEADRIVGLQAIARDITRQKTAEDELRRSAARYRRMIQGAAYGIYRTAMDGRILDGNQALAQILGFDSVEELLRRNMNEIYREPAERQRLIDRYMREGAAMGPVEIGWRRKEGTPITVRITARVVDFGADGGRCFEGLVEDVTTRRALEEQLRQAQKMEAVGRLARGIAHDFNNVLAAIVGCSDLLVARLNETDPAHDDAVEIRKAAERGAGLTRQLLAFSRHQALDTTAVDLHAAMRPLDPMLRRLAGERITLKVATPGPPPVVRIDVGQFEQVLLNLVVNARDAMPDGGTIALTVERVDFDVGTIARFPGLPAGRYARVTAADTGTGIDVKVQDHVFEPFFTTKDAAKGTGLGLSIVYGIAKEAGGTVVFTSEPGRGTTFEVLIPDAGGNGAP